MFIPNGVHAPDWIPEQRVHGDCGLTPLLEPVSGQRDRISVLVGLDHHNAKALRWTWGSRPVIRLLFDCRTPRKNIRRGHRSRVSSIRSWPRPFVGEPVRSLELGCEGSMGTSGCDSGYACIVFGQHLWSASTGLSQRIEPSPLLRPAVCRRSLPPKPNVLKPND